MVLAMPGIHFEFAQNKIKQGALVNATVSLNEEVVQLIESQKLKHETLAGHLYVHSISPFMRKEGGETFEADSVVIFLKVPKERSFVHKSPKGDVTVTWSEVEVIPTEAEKELLFGQFEVPSRVKILTWILVLTGSLLLLFFSIKFYRNWRNKQELRKKKKEIRDQIFSAKQYDEIVGIWQNKHSLIREFPHLEDPFRELEIILFKYQFKPFQDDAEKSEVVRAYNEFMTKVQGGFNGI